MTRKPTPQDRNQLFDARLGLALRELDGLEQAPDLAMIQIKSYTKAVYCAAVCKKTQAV